MHPCHPCVLADCVLWRQKLSRSLLWVQQWLSWAQHPLQALQLCPSGEWGLGPVWEAQLPWLPVRFDQGWLPRLPTLDGIQRQREVLSDHTKCESDFIFPPTTSGIYVRFSFQSVCSHSDQQRLPWTWTLIFVSQISSVFRIRVYEHPDFSGQMLESTEDLRDLADHWNRHEVHSAQVLDGAWVFHELPNFHGRQYLLEEGEYRRFTEWAAMNPKVGSFRSVV